MGRLPPKQPSLSQIFNHARSLAETKSTVCSILHDHKCYKYGLCDFSRKKMWYFSCYVFPPNQYSRHTLLEHDGAKR